GNRADSSNSSSRGRKASAAGGGADGVADNGGKAPRHRSSSLVPNGRGRPKDRARKVAVVAESGGDSGAVADAAAMAAGRPALARLRLLLLRSRGAIQPQVPRGAFRETLAAHAVAVGAFRLEVHRRADVHAL